MVAEFRRDVSCIEVSPSPQLSPQGAGVVVRAGDHE